MKKLSGLLFVLISAFLLFSCEKPAEEIAVSSVAMNPTAVELVPGEKVQLKVSITPSNATDQTVIWSSSQQNIATVSSSGLVEAVAEGIASIRATVGGKSASCTVTVKKSVIEVQSVQLTPEEITLEEGEESLLSAQVLPADATDKALTWASADASVVSVDQSGKIKALKEGTAAVTVSAGGKSARCLVTVNKRFISIERIEMEPKELTLTEGEEAQLSARIIPEDASVQTLTWESSDKTVVSVDQAGKVKALKEGTATITAQADGREASCKVTVKKGYVSVQSVTVTPETLTLTEGEEEKLTAQVSPADATEPAVTWKTSDASIADVNKNGMVRAMAEGTATITATAGGKSATCKVTVNKAYVAVKSVTVSPAAITLTEGEESMLTAQVSPSDASEPEVTWTSSDASVVKVEQSGKISALKKGTATVTATAGGKTGSCKVSVNAKPRLTSLSFSQSPFDAYIDDDYDLSLVIAPADAEYEITWKISDEKIAALYPEQLQALLHTKDFGKATVTVTDKLSGLSASLEIATVVTDFAWKEAAFTLKAGEEHQLKYSCSPSSATRLFADFSNFTFYENDKVVDAPSLISLSPDGKVKALKDGTVGIKPTGKISLADPAKGRLDIKIGEDEPEDPEDPEDPEEPEEPEIIPVAHVALNKTSLNLEKGESETLTATVEPDNATDKNVTWSSSNASVASVTSDGLVSALAEGKATIYAQAGNVTASCSVIVTETPVTPPDAGWLELPAYQTGGKIRLVTHDMDGAKYISQAQNGVRNWTCLWDGNEHVSYWVAYPLNSGLIGSGKRTDAFGYDPLVPASEQPNLSSGSYGGGWSRGHQLPSADRLDRNANLTTFYATNMTPQEQSFNGGIWERLEAAVRNYSKQCDTLYVVTGCLIEGSTTYSGNKGGFPVIVPTHYYKALLYRKGSTFKAIGYLMPHDSSISKGDYNSYKMTIDELESKTGIDFFPNLETLIGKASADAIEASTGSW